jgi:hypothetical protein
MSAALKRRLDALEASQPPRPSLLTPHVLDRFTYDEMTALENMLSAHGNEIEWLPDDLKAIALSMIETASQRDPAPWPSPRNT